MSFPYNITSTVDSTTSTSIPAADSDCKSTVISKTDSEPNSNANDGNLACGMEIGGEFIKWELGKPIFFDDSYEHRGMSICILFLILLLLT